MSQDQIDIKARQAESERRDSARKLEAKNEINDLVWLMSERAGRRIAYRLLADAGVFVGSFTGEALGSAFNEGKRAIGLRLLADLNENCVEQYVLMLREHREDVERERQSRQ